MTIIDTNSTAISPPPVFYVANNIKKRFRRTKDTITSIKTAIIDILEKDNPQTVRQVFYALTVRGVIRKEEIEYQRTVIRLLTEMRAEANTQRVADLGEAAP
jgi:DNA topoisomerase VI subunit A